MDVYISAQDKRKLLLRQGGVVGCWKTLRAYCPLRGASFLRNPVLFCTLLLFFSSFRHFHQIRQKETLRGSMSGSTEFLLYVTVYRLSVLAIGALSIYLGFRLFNRPAELARSGVGTASAEVESSLFTLRLTDFWPGAYFALFGTILIGIMLWQGPPEMKTEEVHEKTAAGEKTTDTRLIRAAPEINLEGEPAPAGSQPQQSDVKQELGKLDQPGMISVEAAVSFANISRVWRREGRIGEALAMARLAYLYGPEVDKAAHLSLLADLLAANGRTQDAAEARAALEKMGQKGEGE
ncbi:MAG: hypothetical protein D3916_05145 [Candidatus Electrothrix sp. MAN1_4]|nr:hypothetical protein [Candidatus Electrothrix sp. MAN1_4]